MSGTSEEVFKLAEPFPEERTHIVHSGEKKNVA